MSHVCPAPTCSERIPDHQLACRGHWYQLPKAIREAVWDAYLPGQSAATMSPSYRRALKDATDFWTEWTR